MSSEPVARIDPATKKDELLGLPDEVKEQLAKHLAHYQVDPVAAHYWDPICIAVPGGPVKCLMLTYVGRKSGKQLQTVLQYYSAKLVAPSTLGRSLSAMVKRQSNASSWFKWLQFCAPCHTWRCN